MLGSLLIRESSFMGSHHCCAVRSPDSSLVDRILWCLTAVPSLITTFMTGGRHGGTGVNLGRHNTLYSTTLVRRCAPEFLDGHTVLELVVLKPSIEVAMRLLSYAHADVDNGFEGLEKMPEHN